VVSSNFHLFAAGLGSDLNFYAVEACFNFLISAGVGSDLNFYAVEACFNFLISAGALFISRKTFASRAA